MLIAAILAGGRGQRFWPESREANPKQFLDLTGHGSLLQETADRLLPLLPWERLFVVTGERYRELVREHLPALPAGHVIGEPVGRNTAASVGLLLAYTRALPGDTVVAVLPADHRIEDGAGLRATLSAAAEAAAVRGRVVTIGIVPDRPETGYGYMEVGGPLEVGSARSVVRFIEKPDRQAAEALLASGRALWNSGMFVWRLDTIHDLICRFLPGLHRLVEELGDAAEEGFAGRVAEAFAQLPDLSVDYGILEKAEDVAVVPARFGWDDVGSWTALDRLLPHDGLGNAVQGPFVGLDVQRCIVRGGTRLVAAVGLSDLIIVDTPDALLILPKERAQEVKQVVEAIRQREGGQSWL